MKPNVSSHILAEQARRGFAWATVVTADEQPRGLAGDVYMYHRTEKAARNTAQKTGTQALRLADVVEG